VATNTLEMTSLNPARARALVFPREHGAWGILLVPLVSGAVVGALGSGFHLPPLLFFLTAALALFLLRTPVESLLGTTPFRVRGPEERRLVLGFVAGYGVLALGSLALLLLWVDFRPLVLLGILAAGAFALQAWVGRTSASARTLGQLIGSIGLTSTAAGAYLAAEGVLDRTALILWAGNWLFAANQIHYVHLRIAAARAADRAEKFRLGWGFLAGEAITTVLIVAAAITGLAPKLAAVAFHPVLLRGAFWFLYPPMPLAIRRLGFTELVHALLFGAFLIFAYAWNR
jgi:hypothetical protein